MFTVFNISAIAIILALTQAFKKALKLDRDLRPLLAVVVGILVFLLYFKALSLNLILEGSVAGLIAVGLFKQKDPIMAFFKRVE